MVPDLNGIILYFCTVEQIQLQIYETPRLLKCNGKIEKL